MDLIGKTIPYGPVMSNVFDLGRLGAIGLGRRELTLWTALVLVANNVAAYLLYPHVQPGWTWFLQSGFGAFDAIAWGVVLWRLGASSDRAALINETIFLLAICAIGSLPAREAAPLAATFLSLRLLFRTDAPARAAGVVLAAIASHQIWGRALFNLFSPEMVKLDAMMVGSAVSLGVPGATWHDNMIITPSGHGIAVFEGCASFTNVSAALLAWVALTKLERVRWVHRDVWVAGAIIIGQVILNVARMYLMALSLGMYTYWHNGIGKEIYSATASAVAVIISVLGARWAERRP